MMSAGCITKALLKSRSGEFDLESIHTVSLKGMELHDLGCIGECSALERLDISYNSISKLHKLAGLENLQYLNLAANRISSLEGLQVLDNLEKLNIAGNSIGGVDTLQCLTDLEKLTSLRLCDNARGLSNPVCLSVTYIANVIRMFPKLTTLDGEKIQGRGSEVFEMFRDVQEIIEAKSSVDSVGDHAVQKWVPDNYWEPSQKFEKSILGDAQQQLEDLLASCKRLSATADGKLKKLQQNASENI